MPESILFYKKDDQKTILYAKELLKEERNASAPYNRLNAYDLLAKSYQNINETTISKNFTNLYNLLNDSIAIAEKHSVNLSSNKMVTNEEDKSNIKIIKIIRVTGIFLFVVFSMLLFLWKRSTSRIKKKYEDLIKKLKYEKKEPQESLAPTKQKNQPFNVPDETMCKLIARLEKFETSERYLKQNITISSLAHQFSTNPKYLSEVIRQCRGKSFNNYINGLRIDYISKKLYEDRQFRLYKISHLAELCGFSSRDVFTSVFKKETGINPSYFIEKIDKQERPD